MSLLQEEIRRLRLEVEGDAQRRNEDREIAMLMHGNGERGHGDNYRDSTFIYIKTFDGDDGSRPIPPGTLFWNSPDVELFDGSTLIATNELKGGHNYEVNVLVTNDGDYAATACTVDLFICHPSLALNLANAKFLGVKSVYINPHDAAFVSFPFSATATDIGHRCLFARAYSAVSKDMPVDADWFNTATDRHTAQQNLSIIQQGEAFMMEFMPSRNNPMGIRIVPQLSRTQQLSRYRFAQDMTFTEARSNQNFELLQAVDSTISSMQMQRFFNMKRQAVQRLNVSRRVPILRRRNTNTTSISHDIRLSALTEALRPVRMTDTNHWQIGIGEEQTSRAVATVLDIPHLGLRPSEASVYQVEMFDGQGHVSGGITLVVTG